MEPRLIADFQCVVGESPLWHPDEQRLYWVDIPTGRMFRYDPAQRVSERIYEHESIGGLTLQVDGTLLLLQREGAVRTWREGVLRTVLPAQPNQAGYRFNDALAEPSGMVLCGTMVDSSNSRQRGAKSLMAGRRIFRRVAQKVLSRLGRIQHTGTNRGSGALLRLGIDASLTELVGGVGLANGSDFTPDRSGVYFTDSTKREIYLFDYDQRTGTLSNRQIFARIPNGEGLPDGLTVDSRGYVWSARFGGGCLVRYAPDGREVTRVKLPAQKVTSVAFGGSEYTDLFVTTAGGNGRGNDGTGAGGLFHLDPGVQGLPNFHSRIGLGDHP